MMKYQEEFAAELAKEWLTGEHSQVRTKIRNLKNKAQAAYIAAHVTLILSADADRALAFVNFMHPNNQ